MSVLDDPARTVHRLAALVLAAASPSRAAPPRRSRRHRRSAARQRRPESAPAHRDADRRRPPGVARTTTSPFIQGVAGDEFYITMQCGIEAEAAKLGVTVDTQGPQKFDPTLQKPIVDSVVASQAGRDPDRADRRHGHAGAAGRGGRRRHQGRAGRHHHRGPVVSRCRRSPPTTRAAAAAAFDAIKQLSPDGGKVLVISTDPGHLHRRRPGQGLRGGGRQATRTFTVPRRAVLAQRPGHRGQLVTAALQKDPDIVGIFATNLFSAEGTATGVRQAGKKDQVKIVGFDAGPDQVKALKDGTVQALVAQQPGTIGQDGVDQAVAALDGDEATPKIQTGFTIITAENVDTTTDAYRAEC